MNHEEELVKAIILAVRQERYLEFLKTPKKRAKFIDQLAHFKHLNPQFVVSAYHCNLAGIVDAEFLSCG